MIYVHFCRSKTCIVAPWVSRERPISADIACSNEDAEDYAEGVRRGGTLVSAKVADADRARLDAILNMVCGKFTDPPGSLAELRLESLRSRRKTLFRGRSPQGAFTLRLLSLIPRYGRPASADRPRPVCSKAPAARSHK